MAHLHSIGMGGRKSADTLDNVMRACDDHALLTDQAIPGGKGQDWYYTELAKIPGMGPDIIPTRVKAWRVAEGLRIWVTEHRPGIP
ncbi:MAG: hypothetical protein GY906_10290 [bacterium]|nr:hypothetical protein [bacterium]